jgi:hypothetical protein
MSAAQLGRRAAGQGWTQACPQAPLQAGGQGAPGPPGRRAASRRANGARAPHAACPPASHSASCEPLPFDAIILVSSDAQRDSGASQPAMHVGTSTHAPAVKLKAWWVATYKAALAQTESGPTGTRQNTQPGLVEVSGCEPHGASARGIGWAAGDPHCAARSTSDRLSCTPAPRPRKHRLTCASRCLLPTAHLAAAWAHRLGLMSGLVDCASSKLLPCNGQRISQADLRSPPMSGRRRTADPQTTQ